MNKKDIVRAAQIYVDLAEIDKKIDDLRRAERITVEVKDSYGSYCGTLQSTKHGGAFPTVIAAIYRTHALRRAGLVRELNQMGAEVPAMPSPENVNDA